MVIAAIVFSIKSYACKIIFLYIIFHLITGETLLAYSECVRLFFYNLSMAHDFSFFLRSFSYIDQWNKFMLHHLVYHLFYEKGKNTKFKVRIINSKFLFLSGIQLNGFSHFCSKKIRILQEQIWMRSWYLNYLIACNNNVSIQFF